MQRLPDSPAALAALDGAITTQARTLAMDDLYYLCGVAVISVVFFTWLLPARTVVAKTSK